MALSVKAQLLHTISAHQGDVNCVAFTSNALASCSSDKSVRLWSLSDFTELNSSPLLGHAYHVHCCAFSPFGGTLATCSTDGKLMLWDMKTNERSATFQHPSNACIRVCQFSSNSCLLVTGSDDMTLCLWDVSSKALIRTYEGHETAVVAAAFSPDTSFLVSGSKNGDLRVWNARYGDTKCLLLELDGHDLGVACCAFSPTFGTAAEPDSSYPRHMLATSGYDNSVRLWILSASPGKSVTLSLQKVLQGHGGPVLSCAFSSNGKILASASGDKTIRLWDPVSGSCGFAAEGHTRYVTSCAFSPDSQYLASGSNDKTVAVWRILGCDGQAAPLGPLQQHEGVVDVTGGEGHDVKHWLEWSVDDVATWLEQIGLSQHAQTFQQHAIDGEELEQLTDALLDNVLAVSALGHRNKILRAIKRLPEHPYIEQKTHVSDSGLPHEFLCPITCEIMKDPVIVSDGYTYERAAITAWLTKGKNLSPMTNAPLPNKILTPNRSIKLLIQRALHMPTSPQGQPHHMPASPPDTSGIH